MSIIIKFSVNKFEKDFTNNFSNFSLKFYAQYKRKFNSFIYNNLDN